MKATIQIITTTPTEELAREMARLLVIKSLAACVQVSGPVASFYRWKGDLQEDKEWCCTIKTTAELYSQVESQIIELHTYEVPEIICLNIHGGHLPYLQWMTDSTSSASE